MRSKATIVIGVAVVIGIAVSWPRRGADRDENGATPGIDGAAIKSSAVQVRPVDWVADDAPTRPSLHARVIAAKPPARNAANEAALEYYRQVNPFAGMTAEEKIAALRAGVLMPLPPMVKGPPGKPALPTGSTKEEVLAAWGPPANIVPPQVHIRMPQEYETGPVETDRIERLEAWCYDLGNGQIKSLGWYFDAEGRLTPRGYTDETAAALEIENALGGPGAYLPAP